MGSFIIIWSLDEWNERNCSPSWKAEMSREQSQINLLRISRRLNTVSQKGGNIWNKLQCKVTVIAKHNLKDIHLRFLQWNRDYYICVYICETKFKQTKWISFYSAAPNICNDWIWMRSSVLICVALTRTMCQEFFFFKRHTNKIPHRQFSLWWFSRFAVTF